MRSTAPPYPVRGLTGACLWVPRAAYEQIVDATGELFDEDFLAYREDAELGLRAERIGVAQVVVPSAVALHGRALRGTTRGNPVLDRLGVQNRFLIAFKHGRHRPGAWLGAPLRDLLVVGGVLTRERHSLPGLRAAWRLRASHACQRSPHQGCGGQRPPRPAMSVWRTAARPARSRTRR